MKSAIAILLCALGLAAASIKAVGRSSGKVGASVPLVRSADAESIRAQGEQRFRANCGRCHAAPQKFPPRMMATVLRHMRVRATITDEDMRLVLYYMTQ
jgi:mono/diheme cytochrome c family protein